MDGVQWMMGGGGSCCFFMGLSALSEVVFTKFEECNEISVALYTDKDLLQLKQLKHKPTAEL
jgi:hypothetical protein